MVDVRRNIKVGGYGEGEVNINMVWGMGWRNEVKRGFGVCEKVLVNRVIRIWEGLLLMGRTAFDSYFSVLRGVVVNNGRVKFNLS